MKRPIRLSIVIVAWMILFQVTAFGADEAPAPPTGSPIAEVVNPEYLFETTVEGSELSHDFIFKNTGTASLDIVDVKTG